LHELIELLRWKCGRGLRLRRHGPALIPAGVEKLLYVGLARSLCRSMRAGDQHRERTEREWLLQVFERPRHRYPALSGHRRLGTLYSLRNSSPAVTSSGFFPTANAISFRHKMPKRKSK